MLPALIATDVDGTLLDTHERVTPRTRAAVQAAVANGAKFVLATGRPPRWIPPVVDALKMARPLEPYQYYAHLPYRSEHWISDQRYALIGDAA